MKQIEVKFISKLFHIPMKCDFCILHIWIFLFFKMILFKKSITIFLVLAMMFQLFQIIQ